MLCQGNVKLYFWAEAVNTACYTQNRSIIVKKHGKTAYEKYHLKVPTVHYFHIFGSTCYILNQRDQLGKIEPKSDAGIFMGYSSMSKAYRVFNNRRKKIEESIHVTFDDTSVDQYALTQTDFMSLQKLENSDTQSDDLHSTLPGDVNQEYHQVSDNDT